jgi:hypothetical protein
MSLRRTLSAPSNAPNSNISTPPIKRGWMLKKMKVQIANSLCLTGNQNQKFFTYFA